MPEDEVISQLRAQVRAIEEDENAFSRNEGGSMSFQRGPSPGVKGKSRGKADPDSAEDALSKIVALVNVSDRSERTVRDRLRRAEFTEAAIEQALDRAKSYGFIDDIRFATTLVRSRLAQGKGVSGIDRELRTHGIDLDSVPGWPEEFEVDESAEFDRAMALLERKPPRSKNLREGAYRKLVSKGFSSPIAASAARAWSEAL